MTHDAVWKVGPVVHLGSWAAGPCCRCGSQPAPGSMILIDMAAQTVLCGGCHGEDLAAIADVLDRANDRLRARFGD